MKYIGVDPGLSGAIAAYDPDADSVAVWDMPTCRVRVAGKNKRKLDLRALYESLRSYSIHDRIAIEAVHAMPKQGVTSSFTFGVTYGAALMAAAGMFETPALLVQPIVWKRRFGLSADKQESRALASKLFGPEQFTRKKDDGRAEAALIAKFCFEHYGGVNAETLAKNRS